MSATLPVIKSTPQGAALLNPFWHTGLYQRHGFYLGPERFTGQPFYWDPLLLRTKDEQGKHRANNLNYMLLCAQDMGKSTLDKCLTDMLMSLQAYDEENGEVVYMRALVEDNRYENGVNERRALTEQFRGRTISSRDLTGINPFTGLTMLQILDLSTAIFELVLKRELTNIENVGAPVAVWKMCKPKANGTIDWSNDAEISPPELMHILGNLDIEDLTDYNSGRSSAKLRSRAEGNVKNVSEKAFCEGAGELYEALHQATGEKFGYMLGNRAALEDLLSGRFVCIDWLGVPRSTVALLRLMIWKNRTYAMVNGKTSQQPHIHVVDELHRIINEPVTAQALEESINTSRSEATINLFSTQYFSQVVNAGETDSAVRHAARNFVKGIAGFFVGKPSEADMDGIQAYREIGFTETEIDLIKQQEQGQFAFKLVGRPAIFFDFVVVPSQENLVRTNAALHRMLKRRSATDFEVATEEVFDNVTPIRDDQTERGVS